MGHCAPLTHYLAFSIFPARSTNASVPSITDGILSSLG
jgi:hypothetical protein